MEEESCSRVRPKRSLERGSCEGLGMPPYCKRLTVDRDHQSNIPRMKKMKLGSERRAIAPLKLLDLSAPTDAKCKLTKQMVCYGKEVVDGTQKRTRRKIEMRPPKAIRDAVLVRMEPDGFSREVLVRMEPDGFFREMHLNCQNKQVSSFEACKDSRSSQIQKEILFPKQTPGRLDPVSFSCSEVLRSGKYVADRRPLVEMMRMDNEGGEVGFKVDEGALKVAENASRNKVGLGIAESRNPNVTRFDKFKPITPASEKRSEDRKETGIIERPNFSCQLAGGSSYGAKCHFGRMGYDFSRPKSSIQNKSSSMIHSSKLECFDIAPSCGVGVAVKHKAKHSLSQTTYDSEGRKNEIISADKLDYLGFKVDKAKAPEQNFTGRKSSTCGGKVRMVGLSDYTGIHNSSYACRDENDPSNVPHNYQEIRCESKVLKLNSIPDNEYQVGLYRDEVMKVLDLYRCTLERLQQEYKMKPRGQGKNGMQICVEAAMQLKHKWLNVHRCVGAVPGVEIGDQYQLRAELVIIGLHSKFVAGIDYKTINGKLRATSIIASGRYGDKNDSPDVLTYVGEGGNPNGSSEKLEDQKLVRGNLALKNSIDEAPVRVIRSIENLTGPKLMHADTLNKSKYFYDGLYFVTKCSPEREPCGNLVYKFQLKRIQGQKELTRWNTQNTSRKSNKALHGTIVVHDISKGKENMPIRVVNAIDCEKPPPFKYITKMMYHHPQQCVISKPNVCDCIIACSEDILCSCVIKNNCELSVNSSVSTAEKKPIVYECGPFCKCPPDCKNRMSQHGIKLQLEVFKTGTTGWGVRSRNFISEGRFICEYVGELLQYKQKEGRIDFDESAFDAGNSNGTEGSQGYPNLQSSSSKDVDDTKNVKFGNVGRFIRHSCSPNLYAKCVLFDHKDKSRPHVMLFAAKNIPPRKEMTFDYKLW